MATTPILKRYCMKRAALFLLTVSILCWMASPTFAEQMYISENIRMVVREGPGNEYKIIQTLMSGDSVDVVESGKDWSKIRLEDGREGWAPTRFLTTQIPSVLALKLLEKKYADLLAQTGGTSEDAVGLTPDTRQMLSERNSLQKQYDELQQQYEALKQDSRNVEKLRSDLEAAKKQLADRETEDKTARESKAFLFLDERLIFFLAGALVLLIGFVLGRSARSKKSHASLLR